MDYALDLKNFHKFSQEKVIVPILVATKFSEHTTSVQMSVYDDRVVNPLVTGEAGIFDVIAQVLSIISDETAVNKDWIISPYAPTPTIVEAEKRFMKIIRRKILRDMKRIMFPLIKPFPIFLTLYIKAN